MDVVIASAARLEARGVRARRSGRAGRRVFFGTSALLFALAVWSTVLSCTSMSDMGEMPMPGGWALSMIWMRMPGQTWLGAAAAFLGMWTVMMAAMMLPSLVPALWRHTAGACIGRMAVLIGAGYFSVWVALGVAVFGLGAVLSTFEMREAALARGVPIAAGLLVCAAGAFQFTSWKAHHLVLCREVPRALRPWHRGLRRGLRLGLHCCMCSAGLTAILLVTGMMDLRTMAAVTIATTLERLAPAGERIARAIGVIAIGAGLMLAISGA